MNDPPKAWDRSYRRLEPALVALAQEVEALQKENAALKQAIQGIEDAWESGDLAAAVRHAASLRAIMWPDGEAGTSEGPRRQAT